MSEDREDGSAERNDGGRFTARNHVAQRSGLSGRYKSGGDAALPGSGVEPVRYDKI